MWNTGFVALLCIASIISGQSSSDLPSLTSIKGGSVSQKKKNELTEFRSQDYHSKRIDTTEVTVVGSSSLLSTPTLKKVDNSQVSTKTNVFSGPVWKGFGITFEKSVVKWDACGVGLKIPCTGCFPNWSKNPNLPTIATTFGINYPASCKISVGTTWSVDTFIYGLALFGKVVSGLEKLSPVGAEWMARLKESKVVDSAKRVGVTTTIKYVEGKGIFFSIGPQFFYFPSPFVLQLLLPLLFSLPAILVTLLGVFIQLENSNDLIEAVGNKVQETRKKIRKWQSPKSVQYWHKKLLKWAASKTTGVGFNHGWGFQSLDLRKQPFDLPDLALGHRVIFELGNFYFFDKTFKRIAAVRQYFKPAVKVKQPVKATATAATISAKGSK